MPIAIGVVLALGVHLAKATARPVVNAATARVGAPVDSIAEDAGPFALAFAALLAPVLVLLSIVVLAVAVIVLVRRRRRSKLAAQGHPSPSP